MKLKGNKGAANSVVVMLMVFILILICLIVYLIQHPMVKYVERDTSSTQTQANVPEIKTETTTTKMTSDEKYKMFADNLKKEVSKYGDTANIQGATADETGYEVRLKSNGDLSLRMMDEKLNAKYGTETLAKNVIAFAIIDVGQDVDWHCVYFINEDGTVGYASIDSVIYDGKGEIKVENKIEGLKNIVAILGGGVDLNTSGALNPLFVDIDGNVYTGN